MFVRVVYFLRPFSDYDVSMRVGLTFGAYI